MKDPIADVKISKAVATAIRYDNGKKILTWAPATGLKIDGYASMDEVADVLHQLFEHIHGRNYTATKTF